MNISRVIFKTAIPSDINDKISRMINQALLYRRTGSKLIDNATRTDESVIFDFGKDFNNKNMIYAKTLSELNDPFEVKGGGLGISLVNVNVFRKMAYPYFKYEYQMQPKCKG